MSFHFLGTFLVQKGVIRPEQLDQAVALQQRANRRIGELAVERGLLTPAQTEEVAEEQKRLDLPFGETAVFLGFLSREGLDGLLFSHMVQGVYLGEALLELGFLSSDQFGALLDEYHAGERERRDRLRFLLEGLPDQRVLAGLVNSLERAYMRFVGGNLKLTAVDDVPPRSDFAGAFRIAAALDDFGRFEAEIHLPEDFARAVGRSFGLQDGGAEVAAPFFAIVRDYFAAALERLAFQVGACTVDYLSAPGPIPAGEPGLRLAFTTAEGVVGLLAAAHHE